MLIDSTLILRLCAKLKESLQLSFEEYLVGKKKDLTFSDPSASQEIVADKAESIPPDKPNKTDEKPLDFTYSRRLKTKALYIGYMVNRLLLCFTNKIPPTDRDSFKYKRVELPGELIYDLFKEYYTIQLNDIYKKIDKEYYYKQVIYQDNFLDLIQNNYKEFLKDKIVETGFKKAFKGNWGGQEHTKRLGIVQDIIRLSFNSYISIMRKINLSMDSTAKVVAPRLLHSSQMGIIDPLDTPDGGNVGLHKHLSISTVITKGCSGLPYIEYFRKLPGRTPGK